MPEVGDKIKFIPTAYIDPGGGNGTQAFKEAKMRSVVEGTVVEVNEKHRWYRLAYQPEYDRLQHECFKF